MKALVSGAIAIDDIWLRGTRLTKVVGGSAIYGSLAASLFADTYVSGVIGKDFSEKYLKLLKNKNINTSTIQKSPKKSLRWKGRYSGDLEKLTTTNLQLNAFDDFKVGKRLQTTASKCKAVFIANVHPSIQYQLIKNLPNNVIKILDSMDLWFIEQKEQLLKVLEQVDIFVIKEDELDLLVEEYSDLYDAVNQIMQMGPKAIIVKKSKYGLTMYGQMGTLTLPSYPFAHTVDPTGAGYALVGGMTGVLAKLGRLDPSTMTTALLIGNVMASFAVEGYATESLQQLTKQEVINRAKLFLTQLPSAEKFLLTEIFR